MPLQTFLKKPVNVKIKVACVFNSKLAFADWFVYNLIILIKLCRIRYLNLDKALLFPRNQVVCLKNWKLWRTPTTIDFIIFCSNSEHLYYLAMSTKGCPEFVLFCLDLELLIINVKNECVETRSFLVFQLIQDLNKIEKSRTPFCRHW